MTKKRLKKVPEYGNIYITTTFNNIIVVVSNKQGDTLTWSSAGKVGFNNTKKKNTPYAAQMVVNNCVKQAKESGMKEVDIIISGVGLGREVALKTIQALGMKILSISDRTPIAHNGCRPPKRKRI